MKRILLAGIVAAAGIGLVPGIASANPVHGTERIQITTVNDQPGGVLARGLFTASGVDYSRTNNDLLVFPDGAFTAHHPSSQETQTFTLNPKTCLAKFTFTGPFTLRNGYGAYQGIKGSGTYVGSGSGVLPRKADGTCDGTAEPFSTVTHITATASVSLP
jgi:hypothetical protein